MPIATPKGRNGFQPELKLVYSTGHGNGPFGLGWELDVPGISRRTSKGVPRNDDADVFLLSGREELVPVGPRGARTRYRPRREGAFALIHHHRDGGSDYWEVRGQDGLTSRYGTEAAAGSDAAVVADPADPRRIFAWKLTRTLDPFGNRIDYVYQRDAGHEGRRRWDQVYLAGIRYVDHGEPSAESFLVSVSFDYGEAERPDAFSEHRAGFEIRTRRRCRKITVATHAGRDRLFRSYELVYLDELVAAGERPPASLPANRTSLLSRLQVVGHADEERQALPPLEFAYTSFEPRGRRFVALEGRDLPSSSLASPELALADLDGDGLPDLLEMNGVTRYWRNLGGGRFDLPREMRAAPSGLSLADPGVQLIDADGDARIDLLVTTAEMAGYFPLGHDGEWDRRSFRRYRRAPSFSLDDPEVRLVDLDGDGVTDAIRSGRRLECFFNDAREGWGRTRWLERRGLEDFPDVVFSDPRVKWADLSGDGLVDVALVHDGSVEYWPSLGHGNWGPRVTMERSPRFPSGYDPQRILLGDVDGDGLADLVYVDHGRVLLWINQGGGGWSEPIEIDGTPPAADLDAVQLADVLGSGIAGVLWSKDPGALSSTPLLFLDFTGGSKPYLLSEMDNQLGAVTRLAYAPSTRFALADHRSAETRWQSSLPFPVHVLACLEVIDDVSGGKLVTEYRYHHGGWDGALREFCGFGMVEQLDTETFEAYRAPGLHGAGRSFAPVMPAFFSPPTLTRTWFHQGSIGAPDAAGHAPDHRAAYWPGDAPMFDEEREDEAPWVDLPASTRREALQALRGRILRTEMFALDGSERQDRPYTVTEYLHRLREESPLAPGSEERPRVFFPFTAAERTTRWDRGDDPMTRFSFAADFDAHGQPQQQTHIACPRGWSHLDDLVEEPFLATRVRTRYAAPADPAVCLFDRVASVTTYEIENDGRLPILTLRDLPEESPALRLIGQVVHRYDGEALAGRPPGEVGAHGALVHTETLVLTDGLVNEAYGSANVPPYLGPVGATAWTAEYPALFRERLPTGAGYRFHEGDAWHARGFFASAERRAYDFQESGGAGRGLVRRTLGPLSEETRLDYDGYELLPTAVHDAAGLTTSALYDYRVLQPRQVTDPNGNRQSFGFTPLGLPAWIAIQAKDGEAAGDTEAAPGTRFSYDLQAFAERRQPTSVRTVRRVHHALAAESGPGRDDTVEQVEYSDGFGRVLQTRAQAAELVFGDPVFGGAVLPVDQSLATARVAGRRLAAEAVPVVVSGWQLYDNKGRVVEKFEPFLSTGWDWAPPTDAERGRSGRLFYDPAGQVVRTVNPDGSERRLVPGIPADLEHPDTFSPSPWEIYTYDENDNAGRTHGTGDASHWDTPASTLFDGLGRSVLATARNGRDTSAWYLTRSRYDARNNVIAVTDALGRPVVRTVLDLANRPLRIEHLDGGTRTIVLDAGGNERERRDGKGALVLQAYDELRRPVLLWARDEAAQVVRVRQHRIYGDSRESGLSEPEARAANLRGRLYRHYDESGRLTLACDFKGEVTSSEREVFQDEVLLSGLDSDGATDWQPPEGVTLEAHARSLLADAVYRTSTARDALGRVTEQRYPQDVTGSRATLQLTYDRGGSLAHLALDGEAVVEHIAYDAKGQRSLVAYGNGLMTRYACDPRTFRLLRVRTESYRRPEPDAPVFECYGTPLQDLGYTHDLAGNVTSITDRTPGSGIPGTTLGLDALHRTFSYDALYRLLHATGRECDAAPPGPAWQGVPRCVDATRLRAYTEHYRHDAVGNLEELRHVAEGAGFTRRFTPIPGTNRISAAEVGDAGHPTVAYLYDGNGNLVRENTERHFEWDHADRLRAFRVQAEGAGPSLQAHYRYDAAGRRVVKVVRRQDGQYGVTVYVDGLFEHHRWQQDGADAAGRQNNHLHVVDGQRRVALVRRGPAHPDDAAPAVQYQLDDHLGSCTVVVGPDGRWLSREEYGPYGETTFGGFVSKRYRFSGKERDEESGLAYHGARYYAPWTARWLSIDPAHALDLATSPYVFARSNPLRFVDPDGRYVKGSAGAISDASPNAPPAHAAVSVTAEESAELFYEDYMGAIPEPEQKFFRRDGVNIILTDAGWEALIRVQGGEASLYSRLSRNLMDAIASPHTYDVVAVPAYSDLGPQEDWLGGHTPLRVQASSPEGRVETTLPEDAVARSDPRPGLDRSLLVYRTASTRLPVSEAYAQEWLPRAEDFTYRALMGTTPGQPLVGWSAYDIARFWAARGAAGALMVGVLSEQGVPEDTSEAAALEELAATRGTREENIWRLFIRATATGAVPLGEVEGRPPRSP